MKDPDHIRDVLRAAGAREITEEINRDGDDGCAFEVGRMRIIASWGGGWDHVSVSAGWGPAGATRVPTFAELESVRRMFFREDETVVQIHPPIDRYVNVHPYVLHLWRSQTTDYPLPPRDFIA